MKYTKEEENIIRKWRKLRRWERLAIAILMNNMACGPLTEKGDRQSLAQMRRMLELTR